MATTTVAPVKVDQETDRLISHAAHFFNRPKKSIVQEAMREYVETHHDELQEAVKVALQQLDGTRTSSVALLSGLAPDELEEVGGLPE